MTKQTVWLFRVYNREQFDQDTLQPKSVSPDRCSAELEENWGAKAPTIARIHEEGMYLEKREEKINSFVGRELPKRQYQLEQLVFDADRYELQNGSLPFDFYEKSPNWQKMGTFSLVDRETGQRQNEYDPKICQRTVHYSLPGEAFRSPFSQNQERFGKPIEKVAQARREMLETEPVQRKERS